MTCEDSIRESKISAAREFSARLGTRNLIFFGISGSVSYEPAAEDDVDIFLITRAGKLWSTVIRAILIRRLFGFDSICLSLCLDTVSADTLFNQSDDFIVAKDSLNVIPLYGKTYYENLLNGSLLIRKFFPERFRPTGNDKQQENRSSPLEYLLYIPSSVFLILKGLVHNHRYRARLSPDSCFKTVLGFHRFYLDSAKYQKLRRMYSGTGDGNE